MTTLKISDETFEEDVINKNNPVIKYLCPDF